MGEESCQLHLMNKICESDFQQGKTPRNSSCIAVSDLVKISAEGFFLKKSKPYPVLDHVMKSFNG